MSSPADQIGDLASRFWPREQRERREREHRDEILSLPRWTLVCAGWLTPSGHVQGGVYYRTTDGCGPTSRDMDADAVLRRAASDTVYTSQPWAIRVLAEPPPAGRTSES
jgi:hypothetical protein